MIMKEHTDEFVLPKADIILFACEDVITTSVGDAGFPGDDDTRLPEGEF